MKDDGTDEGQLYLADVIRDLNRASLAADFKFVDIDRESEILTII